MECLQREQRVDAFSVTRRGSDLFIIQLVFLIIIIIMEIRGHISKPKKRRSTAFFGNQKQQRRSVLAKMAPATGANVPQFALLVLYRFFIHDLLDIISYRVNSGCEMPTDWNDSSCIKPISKKVLDRVESSRSMSLAGKIFYAPRVSTAL